MLVSQSRGFACVTSLLFIMLILKYSCKAAKLSRFHATRLIDSMVLGLLSALGLRVLQGVSLSLLAILIHICQCLRCFSFIGLRTLILWRRWSWLPHLHHVRVHLAHVHPLHHVHHLLHHPRLHHHRIHPHVAWRHHSWLRPWLSFRHVA